MSSRSIARSFRSIVTLAGGQSLGRGLFAIALVCAELSSAGCTSGNGADGTDAGNSVDRDAADAPEASSADDGGPVDAGTDQRGEDGGGPDSTISDDATGPGDASSEAASAVDGEAGTSMNSNEGGPDAGIIVKQLAAGNAFTCALTATGGVKCWGQNGYGSLGNGQTSGVSLAAVDAVGLSSGVQTISAGGYHACAITTANALLCWGLNEFGQLGSGSSIAQGSGSPVEPTAVTSTVSAMAIGDDHSCVVVASTGGVKCWGRNSYGQLGVDPAATSTTGVAVDVFGASSGFKAVAVGDYHSCAITTQGAVKCWGRNDFGEIGSAGPASGSTYQPVTVAGLSSAAVAVVGGHNYTCAMTDLGGVQCWGNDQGFGYLGNGSESGTSAVPVDAVGLSSGAVALSTSNSSYASHVSALTSGGAVLSWGLDEVGQLGDDPKTITATTSSDVPVAAVGVHNAIAVAAGDSHGCAALAAGGVMCWGQSTPAGSSSSSNVLVPISVSGF